MSNSNCSTYIVSSGFLVTFVGQGWRNMFYFGYAVPTFVIHFHWILVSMNIVTSKSNWLPWNILQFLCKYASQRTGEYYQLDYENSNFECIEIRDYCWRQNQIIVGTPLSVDFLQLLLINTTLLRVLTPSIF